MHNFRFFSYFLAFLLIFMTSNVRASEHEERIMLNYRLLGEKSGDISIGIERQEFHNQYNIEDIRNSEIKSVDLSLYDFDKNGESVASYQGYRNVEGFENKGKKQQKKFANIVFGSAVGVAVVILGGIALIVSAF